MPPHAQSPHAQSGEAPAWLWGFGALWLAMMAASLFSLRPEGLWLALCRAGEGVGL